MTDREDRAAESRSVLFGHGGHRRVTATMVFCGTFGPNYVPFVQAKALAYGVEVVVTADVGTVTVVATGPEALVGALEMAACIGTDDARVVGWEIEEMRADDWA